MGALKKALASRVGLSADLLVGAKKFMNCSQGTPKSIADYLGDLKKLFKRAYPTENLDSMVLQQKFLTGLQASICQQLLLKRCSATLDEAVKSARDIESALEFDSRNQSVVPVHVVQQKDESLLHLQ